MKEIVTDLIGKQIRATYTGLGHVSFPETVQGRVSTMYVDPTDGTLQLLLVSNADSSCKLVNIQHWNLVAL